MKKVSWFLSLAIIALALFGAAHAEGADVFDTASDAGRLTARFLQMKSTGGEKPGDATILTSPDGKVMLIDAGETACGPQVVEALQKMGITKIDCLVTSHPHIDHIGGMPAVFAAMEVGAVYTSAVEYPTGTYKAMMDALGASGVEHIILSEGQSFMFGDSVQVEVLHPAPEIEYYASYPDNSTQFINDLSLALKFTYGESTMLFAGDLYTHGEKDVIAKAGDKLDVDVIKINHHGDKTSSSKGWREAVSAKIAVAMHDGIADMKVLEKYHREGTAVYVTFLDGTVKVSTPGDGEYEVLTELERPADFLQ